MLPEEDAFFTQLYTDYFNRLQLYALSHLRDPARAEEVVQDAFHEAVRRIDVLMRHEAPEKWMMQTVKNKVRNSEKARQRDCRRLVSLEEEDPEVLAAPDNIEGAVLARETPEATAAEQIHRALTPSELLFLKRLTLDKATHMEVAQEFDITVWTSQKRLERIREKLGEHFPDYKKKK